MEKNQIFINMWKQSKGNDKKDSGRKRAGRADWK